MDKLTKKVGEIFTIERDVCASTGTNYFLLRLEGGLALIDTYLQSEPDEFCGAPAKKIFVFRCISSGDAAIQFGLFHASDPLHILYEEVLPIWVEDSTQGNAWCGGWSDYRNLQQEDQELFNKVIGGFVGVDYKPLKVATQIVAGLNYCFLCEATSVTNPPKNYHVQITIFAPLPGKGEPYVTNIVRLLGE